MHSKDSQIRKKIYKIRRKMCDKKKCPNENWEIPNTYFANS